MCRDERAGFYRGLFCRRAALIDCGRRHQRRCSAVNARHVLDMAQSAVLARAILMRVEHDKAQAQHHKDG